MTTTAYWAAQTGLRFDGWWPLSGFHVLVIDRDQVSRLGHEWCNRLIPVTGPRRNELGFALLWSMMSGKDANAHQWWADPLNPHMWAISDDSGTLYATIGTQVPAWDQLAEITIGHTLASNWGEQVVFFRDGNGDTWPMPTTRIAHYCAGAGDQYHGHRMASSLATLCDNAGGDVAYLRDDVRGTELECFIAITPPPWTRTRAEIQSMR